MPLEPQQMQKIWIALGISVAFHFCVALVGEVSSRPGSKPVSEAPVVEISRVAMNGTQLPNGQGNSSFNSRASAYSPGANPNMSNFNSLDAGVPTRLKEPPPASQQPQAPAVSTNSNPTPPVQGTPIYPQTGQTQPNSTPPRNDPPTDPNPPVAGGQSASAPSNQSVAGNQGQGRKRGPNRAAFPIETVEPNVPVAMVAGPVTNSVDVSVDIAADGTHVEKIVRSSGSNDVDALVLDAMKRWKWDPAASEGNPIASNQSFKFTFKPR